MFTEITEKGIYTYTLCLCMERLVNELNGKGFYFGRAMQPQVPPQVIQTQPIYPLSPVIQTAHQICPQMSGCADCLTEDLSSIYKICLIRTALCCTIHIEYQDALNLPKYLSLEYNDKINAELLEERDNLISIATNKFRELENKIVAREIDDGDNLPSNKQEVELLIKDMEAEAKEKFSAIIKKHIHIKE